MRLTGSVLRGNQQPHFILDPSVMV